MEEAVNQLRAANEETVIKTQNIEEENVFKKEEIIKLKVKAKALEKEYRALVKGKDDKKDPDAAGGDEDERDQEEELK